MKTITEFYLFGSLSNKRQEIRSHPIQCELKVPTPLKELLNSLQIDSDKVQLAMVNHRAVSLDHVIHPGDRIALFSKEYAIFADWKNFRA
jgi:sulfur carrier protein ThiS